MTTAFIKLGFILMLGLNFTACNKEEFYQKDYLTTTGDAGSTNGGGDAGGTDAGGSSTGGSSTGGASTGGSTTGGSSTGGTSTGGSTAGGSTTGGSYQAITESFSQAAASTKKLDILWVIDDSKSMEDEQAALGTNFSSFIDEFLVKNVDFKMAVTTTDCSSATRKGKTVVGSDVKLTSEKAKLDPEQFKADFRSLVNVGVAGSGNERGIQAFEEFMIKDQSATKVNKFIREDAYLAVVILSDEEDQSPKSVEEYINNLKALKKTDGLVKVYTVVDVNNTNVSTSTGIKTGSARYKLASQNTAGVALNIRDDFHKSLSDMGEQIINLLNSFALANQPVAGSLKVYVSDKLASDYVYDAVSRSIKFNQNALPPVGAVVKVTYMK